MRVRVASIALAALLCLLGLEASARVDAAPVPADPSALRAPSARSDAGRVPPRVLLVGSAQVGVRLVARWGGQPVAARWQTRRSGERWRTLGQRVRVRGIRLTVPAALEGRAIRAQARIGNRWRSSAARTIGPSVRVRGIARVGNRLALVARARGGVRWQSRARGGRWRTIAGASTPRLVLSDALEGQRVRALVREHGRWWPSGARLVRARPDAPVDGPEDPAQMPTARAPEAESTPAQQSGAPEPPGPPVAIEAPTISGIAAVGRVLVTTTGSWMPSPAGYSVRWQRSADGATWADVDGAVAQRYTPGLDSALAMIRVCVTPSGADVASCSSAVGPIVGRPAVGVQDDRLPVAGLEEIPGRLGSVAATGVSLVRFDLLWSEIAPTEPANPADPSDPAYDWARTDAVLAGYAARGITPIVSFYSTPSWAAGGASPPPGTPVNPAIPDPDDIADFVTAVVRRYSGASPAPGAAPLPRLRYLEVWNEPNKAAFLSPQIVGDEPVAQNAYMAMAAVGYGAAKAVDPELTVLVGALGSGGQGREWRDRIIAEDLALDAFSLHLYPFAAPLTPTPAYPSWSSLPEIVDAIDSWRPGLPIMITETGYTTEETPFRPPGSSVTEAEQAQRLSDVFEVPLVAAGRIGAIVWFNFQDNSGWPAGLTRVDGTAKPSLASFAQVVALRGAIPPP